ncbi:MAG: methionyl-tRNA formyltransferase [Parcubacteria group bacterium LiPW_41]|nr:MAG: methionyl-tRNA formyltransferase [Parcubacteria group bacterium LiPW_41]
MSYIFFGTPEFAEIVLKHLIDAGHIPAAVVCNPDRPVGRKKIITPPPVKRYISELPESKKSSIQIFQPEKLIEIESTLKEMSVDLFVVAAYAKIIPQSILDIPKYGTVGVHPSLLPKLRGSSPIQSAILFGEKETGVSLYFVDKDIDHGPVIEEKVLKGFDLNTISFVELHDVLAHLGGAMLAEIIARLMNGKEKGVEQNHSEVTFTKKFISADGFVDHNDLQLAMQGEKERAEKIDRMVRALNPEPGVYTLVNEKRMKLLKTAIIDGNLKLQRIQMEGGVPQDMHY